MLFRSFETVCEVTNLSELNDTETRLIEESENGYNILPGGNNHTIPIETRLKISSSHKGKKMPPFSKEHRHKIGDANRRRVWKQETIAKMRKNNSGENNYWYGKKRPEHSQRMKGQRNPFSRPEVIEKIRQSKLKKKMETIG